jgi:hypothetical protein
MMFIVSLVEFALVKPRMWQEHNIQLANFDMTSSRAYLVSLTLLDGDNQPPSPRFMMITSNQSMQPTAGHCEQVEGKSMKYEVKTKFGFVCSGLSLFG